MSKKQKHGAERLAVANAEEALRGAADQIQTVTAEGVEVLPRHGLERSATEKRAEELRTVEDRIHSGALQVIDDSMYWSKIEEHTQRPPEEWIQELGMDRAMERLRVARANWMNAKEAPVGIKVATQIAMGITRARSAEKAAPRQLNVAFVQMSPELLPAFPELILEPRK